jgi:hypothetical protein
LAREACNHCLPDVLRIHTVKVDRMSCFGAEDGQKGQSDPAVPFAEGTDRVQLRKKMRGLSSKYDGGQCLEIVFPS